MKFTKMQAAGNDYVYVDALRQPVAHPEALAPRVSDRHFGIGGDGLVLICPSEQADFRMRMFNADGTEAEMCGNALRCVGKYVFERGHTAKQRLRIETLAGIRELVLHVQDGRVHTVSVDMGAPVLRPRDIPVADQGADFIDRPVRVRGRTWTVTAVSMGNPHAVVQTHDVASLDLPDLGPLFEHHPLFPKRTNTEFVEVLDPRTIRMRVWERGAGETLACGTGASAAVVACALTGRTGRAARVLLSGGELDIEWDERTGRVRMTGDAVEVFTGEYHV